jgi:hypothetical protein
MQRRNFLAAGTLSLSTLGIPSISLAEEKALNEKSIILIFLAGGASHAEFTAGAIDSVDRYRAVNGYVKTKSGFYLGADFPNLAKYSDLYTVVNGFTHNNSAHNAGSHYVLTGYDTRDDSDAVADHPSFGSLTARTFGANHPETGIPRYVSMTKHVGQRSAFLGRAYDPFIMNEEGKKNLGLNVPVERFMLRKKLVDSMDQKFNKRVSRDIDFKSQAYNMLLGNIRKAFEISEEPEKLIEAYGKGFGQNLLTARRLVQNGVRVVTVSHGGWDHHSNVGVDFAKRAAEIDMPLSILLNDLKSSGMLENTLVVITTEFGRTPINYDAGRDHYAGVTPLIIAGGRFRGGNIVGKLNKNGFEVVEGSHMPIDLLATLMDHLDISNTTYNDLSGRPRYILEGNHRIING